MRKLLGDLAEAEVEHEHRADQLRDENLPDNVRRGEDARARRVVRPEGDPARAGRADGRLGLDAGAGVRRRLRHAATSWDAFLVGLAASIGAGISMAFAEALSDNGSLTGRGAPIVRGAHHRR